MTASELDRLLQTHSAPDPSPDLADRILAAAKTQTPANDTPSRQPIWRAAMGIAAAAIIGFGVFMTVPTTDVDDTTEWEQTAENAGFSDLYAWTLENDS